MDFNVKKLASDAGVFFSRAMQVSGAGRAAARRHGNRARLKASGLPGPRAFPRCFPPSHRTEGPAPHPRIQATAEPWGFFSPVGFFLGAAWLSRSPRSGHLGALGPAG